MKIRLSKISNRILAIAIAAILILLVPLIFAYTNSSSQSSTPGINSIQDVANQCMKDSGNISDASSCAVSVTSQFYRYNLGNAGKTLNFSELKSQGGVCSSWSDYYNQLGQDLGYSTKSMTIPVSQGVSHEFSVWSSSNGYCIMDQTEAKCFGFSG